MAEQRNFTAGDELLLLRAAIAHARQRLAAWLEPDGMSADRCLDELLELIFHPALDNSTAAAPNRALRLEMLRQVIRDSRVILLRHFGQTCDIDGEACLDALLVELDNRYLVEVGGFADLFHAETVDREILRLLKLVRRPVRRATLH